MIRIAIVIAALVQSSATLDSQTLTCSMWQGIRTCSGTNGYMSHETEWQGFTIGDDNQGNRWSTSRWRDNETTSTTVEPSRQDAR